MGDSREGHLRPTTPARIDLPCAPSGVDVDESRSRRPLCHGPQQGWLDAWARHLRAHGDVKADQGVRAFARLDQVPPAALHRPRNTRRWLDDRNTERYFV